MSRFSNRRDFLRIGAASIFGIQFSRILSAEPASVSPRSARPALILLWLDGAPSTIDMWDPKPEAPDDVRGEFATIETAMPGVVVSEHLPNSAKVLDRCTLIRSVYHSIPEHGPGSQYMLTGHLPSPATRYPSLGSVAAHMIDGAGSIPPYLAFNNPVEAGAGYLGSGWNPLEFADGEDPLPQGLSLGADRDMGAFSARVALRDKFDQRFDKLSYDPVAAGLERFQDDAVEVLQADSIRRALDVETEAAELRERYGSRSRFGQKVLKARRLIEAGARFVTVGLGGWDTHSNNFSQLRNALLPQLDRALSALISDLEERGMLDSTIVCCCGEFGRTPRVNGAAGRDHWSRSFSVLLAGAGFRRGLVHGATDEQGEEPVSDACTPADLFATLLDALGIDHRASVTSASGRPMPLVKDGEVIRDVRV